MAVQARWAKEHVHVVGNVRQWTKPGDSGESATFSFCETCGGAVYYTHTAMPDLIAVPAGAFADPNFPATMYSVYEAHMHKWLAITDPSIEHYE